MQRLAIFIRIPRFDVNPNYSCAGFLAAIIPGSSRVTEMAEVVELLLLLILLPFGWLPRPHLNRESVYLFGRLFFLGVLGCFSAKTKHFSKKVFRFCCRVVSTLYILLEHFWDTFVYLRRLFTHVGTFFELKTS